MVYSWTYITTKNCSTASIDKARIYAPVREKGGMINNLKPVWIELVLNCLALRR